MMAKLPASFCVLESEYSDTETAIYDSMNSTAIWTATRDSERCHHADVLTDCCQVADNARARTRTRRPAAALQTAAKDRINNDTSTWAQPLDILTVPIEYQPDDS